MLLQLTCRAWLCVYYPFFAPRALQTMHVAASNHIHHELMQMVVVQSLTQLRLKEEKDGKEAVS